MTKWINQRKVSANWMLNVQFVKSKLKIRKRISKHEDWVSLREYTWGELGHDPEEGLRFWSTIENIEKLVKYVRDFHKVWEVAFQSTSKYGSINAFEIKSQSSENYEEVSQKCKELGLQQHPDYDQVWFLKD